MGTEPPLYRRHRFPGGIISYAVRLYHPFDLSLRDIDLILAERGVVVTHESVRHWCRKFGAEFAWRFRRRRPRRGDTWHLDEVFIRLNGVQEYLSRAADQHGVALAILVQEKRDDAAATGSSGACCVVYSNGPSASSPMACVAMASRGALCCPTLTTGRAGI